MCYNRVLQRGLSARTLFSVAGGGGESRNVCGLDGHVDHLRQLFIKYVRARAVFVLGC